MEKINRQWILARRPSGPVVLEDFELREQPFTAPELKPGEILVQSLLFRCTPAMRTMMKANSQFMPPMPVGETVRGSASARVIDSAHDDYPAGTIVSTMPGWQDYAVVDAGQMPPGRKPDNISLEDFEGVFGGNSITAYFGLLEVGDPQPGETVVVSGAAGSTGSIAAQIARIKQCRVIGIAGGKEKCQWLKDACRLDAVIDYKSENIESRLRELCLDGVNVYFDNVGGATLDAVIENMAPFGRVAEIAIDASANEAYLADGYGNKRVAVVDTMTGAFKRYWGAYGNTPADDFITYVPGEPLPQQFIGPVHCAEPSHDGLIYVCDRGADRIQVFRPNGTFVKEAQVAPNTLGAGATWDIAFSRDPDQEFIYLADGSNMKVYVMDRQSLEVLYVIGEGVVNPGCSTVLTVS